METDKILRPLKGCGTGFCAVAAGLILVVAWMAFAWLNQLRSGLVVTGLRDWGVGYGAPWGLYIATFVWYVGIAHGGIAVSAAIRLLRIEKLRPIARIAEVLTVITLMMAGMGIMLDLGRPDRMFNILLHYFSRIGQSPLVWDITVVLVYLVLSISYLVISMRDDIAALRPKLPRVFSPLYSLVLFGYSERERPKREQMLWWLALGLIGLMALLSGGVVPWLFGLMVSQAGWFNALQGPYFLTAALASALAAVIFIVAVVRKAFGWEEEIKPEIVRILSMALTFFIVLYLYFILQEQLTVLYGGPLAEKAVSSALVFGSFSPLFWAVVVTLAASAVFLGLQTLKVLDFSLGRTVFFSMAVIAALWVKRVLIVVPTFMYPRLPYPGGVYSPTWVEWSLFAGTLAIAGLLFLAFSRVFPLVELGSGRE